MAERKIKTTEVGYINRNNQENMGKTQEPEQIMASGSIK